MADRAAVGTIQATLSGSQAELAWVVGTAHQGRGYASEAALAVPGLAANPGHDEFIAHIHPGPRGVGRRGAAPRPRPTAARQDGEVRWASTPK